MQPLLCIIAAIALSGAAASYCNPIDGPRIDGRWCFLSVSIYCRGGADYRVDVCPQGCYNGYCIREFDCVVRNANATNRRIHDYCLASIDSNRSFPANFDFEEADAQVSANIRLYAPMFVNETVEFGVILLRLICERAYINCDTGTMPCRDSTQYVSNAHPRLNSEMNFRSFCAARFTAPPTPMPAVVIVAITFSLGIILIAVVGALGLLIWGWFHQRGGHAAVRARPPLHFADTTAVTLSAQGQ